MSYIYGDPGLYERIIRPYDLVFDIGAGAGKMSEWYLHRGARVVAVEPEQVDYDKLVANVGGDPRATLLRMALGERQETKELCIYPGAPTISTFVPDIWWSQDSAFKGTTTQKREAVEVTTLDALIAQYGCPRFVKIDVEGYEPWVLRGLSQPVPFVQFEFSGWGYRVGQTQECVARILEVAPHATFNYTTDESPAFEMSKADQDHLPAQKRWSWYDGQEVLDELGHQIATNGWYWGNVFANMTRDYGRRKLARRRGIRKRGRRAPARVLRGARV